MIGANPPTICLRLPGGTGHGAGRAGGRPPPITGWVGHSAGYEAVNGLRRPSRRASQSGHSVAMIEYIAESLSLPSSPGAHDSDHWRTMPSNVAPSPSYCFARAVISCIRLDVDPSYAEALECMPQKRKLCIDVDSGVLSRCCKPCPANLYGTWLIGTPGPGSRVPVGSATHGTIVGTPNLSKRGELARLGLLELATDVVVNIATSRDPGLREGGAILLCSIGQISGMSPRERLQAHESSLEDRNIER